MLRHRGLRLSAAGAAVFLTSLVSLLFLPGLVAAAGMLVGGLCVWAGFIWTLLVYYTQPPAEP